MRWGSLIVFGSVVVGCGDSTSGGTETDDPSTTSTMGPTTVDPPTTEDPTTSSGSSSSTTGMTMTTTGVDTSSGSESSDSTGAFPDDPLEGIGDIEIVEGGFQFLEGPVWLPDDGMLLFTDIPADSILQYTPGSPVAVFEMGEGNFANGLNLDENGDLIVSEHATRRVTRRTDRGVDVVADFYMGDPLHSPNDNVVHRNGGIYFTDPPYGGNPEVIPFYGVYRVPPGGGDLEVVDDTLIRPNGIGLSPDDDVLYVADTQTADVIAYPVDAGGSTGPGTVLANVGGGADGMAIDVSGNLFVTAVDGIVVLDDDGTEWGTITVPLQPANCAFGDDDRRTLYITARTVLYSVRLAIPGLPPP